MEGTEVVFNVPEDGPQIILTPGRNVYIGSTSVLLSCPMKDHLDKGRWRSNLG